MANATESRHYDDRLRDGSGVAPGTGADAIACEQNETLVASVAAVLDRLSEQIFGSG